MARSTRQPSLDAPRGRSGMLQRTPQPSSDRFGRFSEAFAREVVALRMAVNDFADQVLTRDVLRSELRAMLEKLESSPEVEDGAAR